VLIDINKNPTLILVTELVKTELAAAEKAHDFEHTKRVINNAFNIIANTVMFSIKDINIHIVYLTALLHDIADSKFHNGDHSIGSTVARKIMLSAGIDNSTVLDIVCDNVLNLSWSTGKQLDNIEGQIVQDADRLEAIGAVGIARCFIYNGSKNKSIKEALMHFDEKLLLIKDKMNTVMGKKLAIKRHQVLVDFLKNYSEETESTFFDNL